MTLPKDWVNFMVEQGLKILLSIDEALIILS